MKYSSGYANTTNNFVLSNITKKTGISHLEHSLFSCTKNIIQRGLPSNLSVFLKEYYPKLETRFIPLVPKKTNDWKNILGSIETNDYPAEDFFKKISAEQWFMEYSFVDRLLIPEVELNSICTPSDEFTSQRVDFYLPQDKLVIEIDGASHKTDAQINYDLKRDKYLKKHGIAVYRLSSYAIKHNTESVTEFKQELTTRFRENKLLQEYLKELKSVDLHDIKKVEELTTIFRFQILVLELLDHGHITLDAPWNINLKQDLGKLFELAVNDLLLFLKDLYILAGSTYQKPQMNITHSDTLLEDAINIDFDLYERATGDETSSWITVRTDFREDLNHYRVSTGDRIPYKLNEKNPDQRHALESLAKNILQMEYFEEFRHGQIEIIMHLLNGNNTLGLMPTGGGKSLTYQLAFFLQPAIGFVVEPINSLMRDQVQNLTDLGITRISELNSTLELTKKEDAIHEFGEGMYQFVFVSPERFQTAKFRLQLKSIATHMHLEFAVIDEVHCLSEWGHDFRTSYLRLAPTIREIAPKILFLGLTATASANVREDILLELGMTRNDLKRTLTFTREELDFHVYKTPSSSMEKERLLLEELQSTYPIGMPTKDKNNLAGIVFANRANTFFNDLGVYQIAKRIQQVVDIDAQAYTSTKEKGVLQSDQEFSEAKTLIQDRFKENKFPLMVATKSFGMGIDKRNIRYTIHYDLPQSLEQLYQEAGRAGRDGLHADSIVYFEETTVPETVMERLFHPTTGVDEVNSIRSTLKGSLSSMLYFAYNNLVNIESETELMYYMLNQFKRDSYQFVSSSKTIKDSGIDFPIQNFEHMLYRLSLLGIVKDWTVENWNDAGGRSYTVLTHPYNEQDIKLSMMRYINKYDQNFIYEESTEHYHEYYKLWVSSNKPKTWKYMYLLNLWNYDNFVYSRRQSIKNIYEACQGFEPSIDGKAKFKQKLESYFAFTDSSSVLEEIAYLQDDVTLWVKLYLSKEGEVQLQTRAEEIDVSIKPLIETYRYHTGLNFVSGLNKLILNQFDSVDGKERLVLALENILNYSKEKQNEFFSLIKTLLLELPKELLEELMQTLLEYFPHKAEELYNIYHDQVSLSRYLESKLERLHLIKENILW